MSAVKDYQLKGIDFLHGRRRAILGDDAGLGKSLQLIRAANQIGLRRVLILTPAVGRGSWKLQLDEWDDTKRPVLAYPRSPKSADRYSIPKGPLALIVNLEWLSRPDALRELRKAIGLSDPFDVAFVDEAHNVKNAEAKRTKAVYGPALNLSGGVLEDVGYRWLATATPTPLGHVGELYPHLRALFPDVLLSLFDGKLPNQFAFEARFCNVHETRFGREVSGNNPETIVALREALAPFILMRRKADVLTELPPILTIALPLETGFKTPSELTDAEIDAMTDEEIETFLTHFADKSARRLLGQAKAEAVLPWIVDFLAANKDRKLLVFAHHRDVIEHLRDGLNLFNPVTVYGGITPDRKEAAVNRFQSDPTARVFIGQNIAAGVAITLTAADTVLLLEPHPSPDQNYQIISRSHRLGQTNTVTAVIAYDEAVAIERRQARILRRRADDNADFLGVSTPGVIR